MECSGCLAQWLEKVRSQLPCRYINLLFHYDYVCIIRVYYNSCFMNATEIIWIFLALLWAWPDWQVSTEFLRAPISRKRLGSTNTTISVPPFVNQLCNEIVFFFYRAKKSRRVVKKNPLKHLRVMLQLNPAAAAMRKASQLQAEKRQMEKKN